MKVLSSSLALRKKRSQACWAENADHFLPDTPSHFPRRIMIISLGDKVLII